MKKKRFVFLFALALILTSCLFDSSENGLDSWMDAKGVPTSYKVQTLTIGDIQASSVEAFMDTTPRSADLRAVLGRVSNLSHDMVMDIAFAADTNFLKSFKDSDSAGAFILLAWLKDLYKSKHFPSDSLDVEEDLDLQISWKFAHSGKKKFADSLSKISDSTWYASLSDWDDALVSDTTVSVSLAKLDSSLQIDLPSAIVDSLKNTERYTRLQIRISAPKAARAYRFYGADADLAPKVSLYTDSSSYLTFYPSRMVNISKSEEDCSDCPVLHGGVYDSLVVEIPPEPILKALSEFYGEDFPVSAEEEFDVRQNVVMAELTMARDDSKGSSELGLPIQVVAGSFVDSLGAEIRKMEKYRVNSGAVVVDGHQNLIFHDGDSLKLQLTYGIRDFMNRAADGRSFKFMMRMGYPFLQEKDSTYENHITDKGDTSYVFLDQFDYARYDFTSVLEKPMTLKLWLASKREFKGEDE